MFNKTHTWFHLAGWMASLLMLPAALLAEPATTGEIKGTVLNDSTGNFLNNAKVAVAGTAIATYTNELGEYRLVNVPAGEAIVEITFSGLEKRSASVRVTAGTVVESDFTLRAVMGEARTDREVFELERMSVRAQELSGQAIARTEQRNAGNIKNVITPEEFADVAGGNLGEYIKFVPGVEVVYDPFEPTAVGIRGMPANGTLVQFDGLTAAGTYDVNSRSFDLNTAANANIERIEVTKSPTPDMSANAIGGAVNVISKRGFSRKTPLFTYSLYTTYTALPGEFNPGLTKAAGVDAQTTRRPLQLNYDLTYILPINRKVAFTFSYGQTNGIQEAEYISPTWDVAAGMLTSEIFNQFVNANSQKAGRATFDWRMSPNSSLQINYYGTARESMTRANWMRYVLSASGRTGDGTFVQGRGNTREYAEANDIYRSLDTLSAIYKYDGKVWKFDTSLSYSQGSLEYRDMADGMFNSGNTILTPVRMRVDGLDGIYNRRVPVITATTDAGVPIPQPFDANLHTVTTVTSEPRQFATDVKGAGANLERMFDWKVPTRVRIGVNIEQTTRDTHGGEKTWTFTPPGGAAAAVAGRYDLIADGFSDRTFFTDVAGGQTTARYISLAKLYDLYTQNPSWFVLNEPLAYTNLVNASQQLEETVTAGYVRFDNRFFNNRLRIVSGVRYEGTADSGSGPLVDANAIYQRNADGTFVLAGGNRVLVTSDPLAQAKLVYKERGIAKDTSYGGFYPSLNLSYNLADNFVLRASYARTIRRPDLSAIIPSLSISDPDASATGSRVVTVVDGSLRAQNSDSFDLTLETYDWKGITASVGVFQKNLYNSFTRLVDDIDQGWLDRLNLPQYYLDEGYSVSRVVNAGTAQITGLELNYRQALTFIPKIGNRLQFFSSYTKIDTGGQQASTIIGYSRQSLNGGISFVGRKFVFKLNATYRDWRRLSLSSSGIPTMVGPSTRLDLSTQYNLSKRLGLFCSITNLTAAPEKRYVLDSTKPEYTWPREFRYLGVGYRVGIKGSF